MKLKNIKDWFSEEFNLQFWVMMLIVSQLVFWMGFHNVDWSVNMRELNIHIYYITNQTEENFFQDKALGGETFTYKEGYRYGMIMMIGGMWFSYIFSLEIGKRVG